MGSRREKALAEAAEEGGVSLKGLWEEMPRIGGVPFSSERKLMNTVHPVGEMDFCDEGGTRYSFEKCAYCLDGGDRLYLMAEEKARQG